MLHLSNFYKTAASIPLYSIEKGYTYLHADQKKKPKDGGSSTRTSRAASPIADTASQTSTRLKHSTHIDDDFEIAHSFNLTLSYGDEFMDENPLIGEPGAFKLSSTGRTIKEKEAKEKAEEVRREKAVSETAIMSQIVAGSRVESPAITLAALPALKTNVERKSSVAVGKAKSPTSATGEGGKKRRKSKAPITPGAGGSS
jgi:mediator of RNA polymerase II transcription subunit 6